jgi:hypothetical protein
MMLIKFTLFGLLSLVVFSAEAETFLTNKSSDHSLGFSHEAVRLPQATNGAPWAQSTGLVYKLNQYEEFGDRVVFQPYFRFRFEGAYQLDSTRYDSNREEYQHRTNLYLDVPLTFVQLGELSTASGFEFDKNGPEIQEFYTEIFTGVRLTTSPDNIPGLRLAGMIAIAKAEYEVDDEVGIDFGQVGRDQLNHQGMGRKYQFDSTYAFGNNQLSLELARTQVDDDQWDGDYRRDKIKLSYLRQINDKLGCAIKATRTENDYNNNILGFDDIVIQVSASCNWRF